MSSHGSEFNNASLNSIQQTLSKTQGRLVKNRKPGNGRQDFRDSI